MKKIILVCLMGLGISYQVLSQAKENGIKINPLGLIVGAINVQYERAVTEKNSVQLGLSIINFTIFDTKLNGFGITPEFRFYLSKEALDGFYVAPLIGFNNFTLKIESNNSEASLTTFGGGAKIGWNWLLGSNDSFIIDLGLGANYQSTSLNVKSGNEDDFDFDAFSGLRPVLNFGIGYAF